MRSSHERIYGYFLLLYPKAYRHRFGAEMLQVFNDMYEDHEDKGIGFWTRLFFDSFVNAIREHVLLLQKEGMTEYMKKNWHITKYNIIGGLLLLPLVTVFSIDTVARILQGNLDHYNRPLYNFLSHTPLYWVPVLFTWVIVFPVLAVIINIIPLAVQLRKKRTHVFTLTYVKRNAFTLSLLALGLGFLVMIKLHDFVPCIVHGLTKGGIGQFLKILSYCRNA